LSAIPLDGLRLFGRRAALVFGLQWLRKAILARQWAQGAARRSDGVRVDARRGRRAGVQRRGLVLDWYAFTLSYKGVLPRAWNRIIALTSAPISTHSVGRSAAVAAVLVVAVVGMAVRGRCLECPRTA